MSAEAEEIMKALFALLCGLYGYWHGFRDGQRRRKK